jgi:hypothetical protein
MTSITGNLTIDEAVANNGSNQDDVDYATWSAANPALATYLGTLPVATQSGFPQVAERDDMIDFSTASQLALAVTNGGVTGFTDIAGNAITLSADVTDPNIILGIADGEISFAVVLDVVDNGTTISSAKCYVVQYEALFHPIEGQIDSLDVLDLTGLIQLDVTTTTFESHFEPLNFAAIPSGSPQETLTVPTTSTTDDHSVVFNGLIFPTGALADPTTVPKNSGTNDDLNPDAVGFGVKGGQASQLNQNEGFFAQDSLWTSGSPDANEISGLRFDIQGIGGVKTVNVEYWLVEDGAVVENQTVAVQLPSGNAVYEDFTIQSATSFDQVYVRFTYDTKLDTSGVRIENFETLVSTQTQIDTVVSEDLGQHVIFQDDGPTIGAQTDSEVQFAAGETTGDVALTNLSIGVDVPGEVFLTSVPTNWHFDDPNDLTPNSATDPTGTFQITVDNDSYKFDVLKDAILSFQPLDFSAIPSGSPQETLTVPTASATDDHSIAFNGLIFPGTVANPTTVATNSGTNDDLNPDAVGFGVKGGQASQMNQNEGFFAQDSLWTSGSPDANEITGLKFDIQGIGGVKTVNVEYWLVDNGAVVGHETEAVALPSGNAVAEDFTIESATSFDQVYVRFFYDTKVTTSGVRVENFETQVPEPIEPQQFTFGINVTDQDLDPALGTTFTVDVVA